MLHAPALGVEDPLAGQVEGHAAEEPGRLVGRHLGRDQQLGVDEGPQRPVRQAVAAQLVADGALQVRQQRQHLGAEGRHEPL